MLGQDVIRAAGADAVGFTHAELDVTDATAVREALADAEFVLNCAAYTAVDRAEEEPELALQVNRDGARNVAEAAAAAGAGVVYVSTDYVFDGTKSSPYVESDPPNPLSAYGRSKLEGEHATLEANPRGQVVRTSWLYGAGGGNFVARMLRLGGDREALKVVDDQIGSPTFTGHLARVLVELAQADGAGIVHVTGAGSCSWFEFARAIFERTGIDVEVQPCTTDEFPRPAPRPANSVLASERGAPELPAWQDGLEAYLGVRA
jgi:dTDP-4-dehydrorhamnose reductase